MEQRAVDLAWDAGAEGNRWDAGASLDQNGNTAQMSKACSVALLQIWDLLLILLQFEYERYIDDVAMRWERCTHVVSNLQPGVLAHFKIVANTAAVWAVHIFYIMSHRGGWWILHLASCRRNQMGRCWFVQCVFFLDVWLHCFIYIYNLIISGLLLTDILVRAISWD